MRVYMCIYIYICRERESIQVIKQISHQTSIWCIQTNIHVLGLLSKHSYPIAMDDNIYKGIVTQMIGTSCLNRLPLVSQPLKLICNLSSGLPFKSQPLKPKAHAII